MKHRSGAFPISRPWLLRAVALGLAIAIFIADTLTNLEIAVAVFYVAVVLIAVSVFERRGALLVSAGCSALTLLSFFLTRKGAPESGLINCVISLLAISTTTYLALKIESARTAAQEARAQLAHVARVTALGELTASIAHEVNQPLTAVVTSGNACLRWLAVAPPNVDKARQAAERIVRDANRASEVVGRVRALANRASPHKEPFDINEAALEILALTRGDLNRHSIDLKTDLADDLPPVRADRVQLQQVMLNLIINAIEALSAVDEASRELLVRTARSGPKDVHVAVCDTGTGLDPATRDRLFEAFHTTKRDGMGLGLTISRSIVDAHGGTLWAEPNAPRGSIFEFTIPIEGEAAS